MTQSHDDEGRPQPVVQRGGFDPAEDPLGVDTSRPFWDVALEIAERARSGRAKAAVQAEIDAVEKRLELRR